MASSVKINFKLAPLPEAVAEEVVLRTVEKTATLAKQFVRVDTGDLRSSITAIAAGTTGEVYSDSDHAVEQEFGMPDVPSVAKQNTAPKNGPGGPYTFTPYLRPAVAIAGSQAEIDKSTEVAMRRLTK